MKRDVKFHESSVYKGVSGILGQKLEVFLCNEKERPGLRVSPVTSWRPRTA